MKNKLLLAAAVALGMSGCATMPEDGEILKSNEELSKPLIESWKSTEPAIKYFKIDGAMVIEEPNKIPAHIKNVDIQTKISPQATLADIGVLLDQVL